MNRYSKIVNYKNEQKKSKNINFNYYIEKYLI